MHRKVLAGVLLVAFVSTTFFSHRLSNLNFLNIKPAYAGPTLEGTPELAAYDQAIQHFESTPDVVNQGPGGEAPKILGLNGQRLELFDPETGKLLRTIPFDGRPLTDAPEVYPRNHMNDIRFAKNEAGEFCVEYHSSHGLEARIVVPDLKPKTDSKDPTKIVFARDGDYVVVLGDDNRLKVIDYLLLRSDFLKTPVLVANSHYVKGNEIDIEWIAPNSKVPEFPPEYVDTAKLQFRAGNLLVTHKAPDGTRRPYAALDRDAISIDVYTQFGGLVALAPVNKDLQVPGLVALGADPEIRKYSAQFQSEMQRLEETNPLYLFGTKSLNYLIGSATSRDEFFTQNREARHLYSYEEWLKIQERMAENKASAEEKARIEASRGKMAVAMSKIASLTREGIRKALTPMFITKVVGVISFWNIADAKEGDFLFHWKLSLYSQLQNISGIFHDVAYSDIALKGAVFVTLLVPLTQAIGTTISALSPRFKNFGFKKTLATIGMRVFGVTVCVFTHGLARVMRQPLFFKAALLGINPFTYLRHNDSLKETLKNEGIQIPDDKKGIRLGLGTRHTHEARSRIISIQAAERQRLLALSTSLAFIVAAENAGADPALILALSNAQVDKMNDEEFKKKIATPEFKRNWKILSESMIDQVIALKDEGVAADLASLDKETIGKLFEKAQATLKDIKRFGFFRTKLAEYGATWKSAVRGSLQFVAANGKDASVILSRTNATDFVANMNWVQFSADLIWSAFQIPLWGSRANLGKPENLAGDPHGFAYLSGGHSADMVDQYRIYMFDAPSRQILNFYKSKQFQRDTRYNDLNVSLSEGGDFKEHPLETIKNFTREATNLRKAEYGYFFWHQMKKRASAIQSMVVWSMVGRVLLVGQDVGQAFMATLWFFFMAQWTFGWVWDPIVKGLVGIDGNYEKYNANILERRKALLDALSRGAGLEEIHKAASDLVALYPEEKFKDPRFDELRDAAENLKILETSLASMKENQSAERTRLRLETAIADVYADLIVDRDFIGEEEIERVKERKMIALEAAVKQAQEELRISTSIDPSEKILRLSALTVLAESLRKLPQANKPNGKVVGIINVIGAAGSTLLGTLAMVISQDKTANWMVELAKGGALSLGLFAFFYKAQTAFNRVYDSYAAERAGGAGRLTSCRIMLGKGMEKAGSAIRNTRMTSLPK